MFRGEREVNNTAARSAMPMGCRSGVGAWYNRVSRQGPDFGGRARRFSSDRKEVPDETAALVSLPGSADSWTDSRYSQVPTRASTGGRPSLPRRPPFRYILRIRFFLLHVTWKMRNLHKNPPRRPLGAQCRFSTSCVSGAFRRLCQSRIRPFT